MSKTTTNYGLIKPELTDSADITATNSNWDKIDAELKKNASLAPPTSGINLYVSPTGNDSTGDGTEAKPFRQIQKAIESLPKNLGGQTVHIYVASGEYTNVTVEGFYGGNQSGGANLRINSAGTDGVIINGYIRIRGCDVQVNFGKATLRGSTAGYDVIVYGCKHTALVGLNCADASVTKGIVVHSSSYVLVNGCTLSNKEIALEAAGGMVMAHALKGTNNACAIKSGNTDSGLASTVYVAYRSITATTLYSKVNGGVIFENGNEIDAVIKAGDTIGGTGKIDPLAINGGDTTTLLKFRNKNNDVQGYVGYSGQKAVVQGSDNNPKALYHEGNKPTATDVGAVPTSGGTMTGVLTSPQIDVTDGYTTTTLTSDGAFSLGQITVSGDAGSAAFTVSPNGLKFWKDAYEYEVVHAGNISRFLGVAPATVE